MPANNNQSRGKRSALKTRILIYGGLVVMAIILLPRLVRGMIYPVPEQPVPDPPPGPVTDLAFTDPSGGRQSLWSLRSERADELAPVVLFFHGNAQNLASLWTSGIFHQFTELGVHFVAWDFPGYGNSEGKPTEAALIEGGRLALEQTRAAYPTSPIYLMGWSLGAAVAVQTAATHHSEITGLILASPWTSLGDVARAHFPNLLVRLLVHEHYDSLAIAAGIPIPALVLHGSADSIIPVEQGQLLAQTLPDSRWIRVDSYDHNDIMNAPQVWSQLGRFLVMP